MKSLLRFASVALVLFLATQSAEAQETWLTDEQAREIAVATVRAVYPRECYSTYRKEALESWVFSLRRVQLLGKNINRSIYIYGVAFDSCEFVGEKDGKPTLNIVVIDHEANYGVVAVDRSTKKTYWFRPENKPAEVFNQFAKDLKFRSGDHPQLLAALYCDLVWGKNDGNELHGITQLRSLVEDNFRSAYSPYERDEHWERKFTTWWREFRSRAPKLSLGVTAESTSEGFLVRGFSFQGFHLTIPRTDPPPEGVPTIRQWTLLLRPDGTVEERGTKLVYVAK